MITTVCHRMSLIFILTFIVIIGTSRSTARKQTQPHIIMLLADDLGWDDISFHGSSQIPTPNIDRLAHNGVILHNYYVQSLCSPSRAALMTGRHPIHLGLQHGVIFDSRPHGLPLDAVVLPQYLSSLDYVTRAVGKWHLGFYKKEYTPTYRGFDSHLGYWNGKQDYWSYKSCWKNFDGFSLRRNMQPIKNETGHYSTHMFTEEAVQIIHSHNTSRPLFLYFAHQSAHSGNKQDPLQAPAALIKKYSYIRDRKRQVYAAMVDALDQSVGRIVKALKDTGMLDNSVVVFSTDNGGAPYGYNMNMGSNYPLRGTKGSLWEGGVRGVGLVHSPLIKKPGRISNELMHVSDWLPTLYHLAGGDLSQIKGKLYGVNMWYSISTGSPSPRKEVLLGINPWSEFAAIRRGKYKLIINMSSREIDARFPEYKNKKRRSSQLNARRSNEAVISCGNAKKNSCDSSEFPCLFNIIKDPCELHNLASKMPKTVLALLKRLQFHQSKAKQPNFPKEDPRANPKYHGGVWSPWRVLKDNRTIVKTMNDIPQERRHPYDINSFGNQVRNLENSSETVKTSNSFLDALVHKLTHQNDCVETTSSVRSLERRTLLEQYLNMLHQQDL